MSKTKVKKENEKNWNPKWIVYLGFRKELETSPWKRKGPPTPTKERERERDAREEEEEEEEEEERLFFCCLSFPVRFEGR